MSRLTATIIVAFLAMIASALAYGSELTDIAISSSENQTNLEVFILTDGEPKVFMITEGNPRVVIDLPDASLSKALNQRADGENFFPGGGAIEKLRFARRGDNDLRLVADLMPGAKLASNSKEAGKLLIRVDTGPGTELTPVTDATPGPRLKPSAIDTIASLNTVGETITNDTGTFQPIEVDKISPNYVADIPVPSLKTVTIVKKFRKPVIVIDPGHGGYDPGAVGSKKVKEETVTLAAAKELRSQLLATGRYNVVLTRDRDVYIAHEERVRIARKAGANLFISIHADSTSKSTTRGASVYTLADRAQKRSQKLISSQNWILDVDLSDQSEQVGDILVDLAQRKTLTKSAQFAEMLLPELSKYSALVGNSHRRAGYYVLLAPDVPAVLLEMGFLSNEKDERLINSSHHRHNLMKAVTKTINEYFAT